MDRNRLLVFIAISAAILFGFQILLPGHHAASPNASQQGGTHQDVLSQPTPPDQHPGSLAGVAPPHAGPAMSAPGRNVARVRIMAPRVQGSIALVGARLDDLLLRDYHDTVQKTSPLVRLLAPGDDSEPSSIQFGWTATDGTKTPDDSTLWTSSGGDLTDHHKVTLTWDNGQGQVFTVDLAVDQDYMFSVHQSVRNTGTKAIAVVPWQRARRDYTQPPAAYSVLFEGLKGVAGGLTHEQTYPAVKKQALTADGIAYSGDNTGGWAGFIDKYWLTALIPEQASAEKSLWYYSHDDNIDHYQVSYQALSPLAVAPGGQAQNSLRLFAGAKEVHLLDRYETKLNIPLLSYAVDWGWFYFLTKPFFYAIDFLFSITGNFGVAILIFTLFVKVLFYPLASKSYESMGKMRLLGPKIQAARERYKDDPAKQQAAMMEVYKAEGVNPAAQVGGCLPMLLQIPVFFSLYKVILVTIEMRHAPFFGWIQDLSATDPTNIFNLFGLLPIDPTVLSPTLHLGVWPLLLGASMFFQQKLNPPPPDPVQARMFQFMPLIFMFMMGRFPAGLVVYWTWNNTLTIGQQWWIQKNTTLKKVKA